MSIPVAVGVAVIGTGLGLNPWTIGCGAAAMNFAAAQSGSGIKLQGDAGRLGNQRVEVLPKEVASNLRAEVVGTGNLYSAARAVKNLATGSLGLLLTVGTGGYAYKKSPVVKDMTKKLSSGVVDALQVIPGVGNQVAAVRNKRNFQQAVHLEKQEKEQEIVDLETKIADLKKACTDTSKKISDFESEYEKVQKNIPLEIFVKYSNKNPFDKIDLGEINEQEFEGLLKLCQLSKNMDCLKNILDAVEKDSNRANLVRREMLDLRSNIDNMKAKSADEVIIEFKNIYDINYLQDFHEVCVKDRSENVKMQLSAAFKEACDSLAQFKRNFIRQQSEPFENLKKEKLNATTSLINKLKDLDLQLNDLKEKLYQKKLVNLYEDLVDKNRQYAAHAKQRPASFGIRHPLSCSAMARWNRKKMQLKQEMEQANRSFVKHLKDEDLQRLGWVCDQEGMCCVRGNVVHRTYLAEEATTRNRADLAPANVGCRWDSFHENQINNYGKIFLPIVQNQIGENVKLKEEIIEKIKLVKQYESDKELEKNETEKRKFQSFIDTIYADILSHFTFRELLILGAACDKEEFCCGGGVGFKVPRENMVRFLNDKIIAQEGGSLGDIKNRKYDIDYLRCIDALYNSFQEIRNQREEHETAKPQPSPYVPESLYQKEAQLWKQKKDELLQNYIKAAENLLGCLREEDLEDLCSVCNENGDCCGGNLKLVIDRNLVLNFLSPPEAGYAKLSSGKVINWQQERNKIDVQKISALQKLILEKTAQYEDFIKQKPALSKSCRRGFGARIKKEALLKEAQQSAIFTLLRTLNDQDLKILGSVCDEKGICYGAGRGLQVGAESIETIAKERGAERTTSGKMGKKEFLFPAPKGYRRQGNVNILLQNEQKQQKERVAILVEAIKAQKAYDTAIKNKGTKKTRWNFLCSRKKLKDLHQLKADYHTKVRDFMKVLTDKEIEDIDEQNNKPNRSHSPVASVYDHRLKIPAEIWNAELLSRGF